MFVYSSVSSKLIMSLTKHFSYKQLIDRYLDVVLFLFGEFFFLCCHIKFFIVFFHLFYYLVGNLADFPSL